MRLTITPKIKVDYVDTLNIKKPGLRDEELNGAKNMLKVVLLQNDEIYDKLLALGNQVEWELEATDQNVIELKLKLNVNDDSLNKPRSNN